MARSERLVRDVQHLLLRLGVVTAIRPEALTRHGESFEALVLSVADVDVSVSHDRELVLAAAGPRRGRRDPCPARSGTGGDPPAATSAGTRSSRIEHDGDEQVYDLTVPGSTTSWPPTSSCTTPRSRSGMATHVAVEQSLPVLFFSLEMGHKELTQRILAAEARVDSQKMRTGRLTEQDWSKIGKAIGRLEAPLYIDDNPNVTVMEIRAKARRLKARSGDLGLIVVDYLQLMSGRAGAENRQVEVSEISRGLKILARELEVPIVALSQLCRNLEARADKRPMLSDLRESGSIEQDADVVMFIYRDEVYNPDTTERGVAEIIVAKHRNGPTGSRRLVWLAPYTRFDNAARNM